MTTGSLVTALVMLLAGMAMLGIGASKMVDGASRLALRLRVSPMVVGLTLVGFGTSLPELSVSVLAAARGSGGLGLGNAVGSNVMNLLLVLGAAAVVHPIQVVGGRRALGRDLLFGLVPALILLGFAWDGRLDRGISALLLAVFVLFMAACARQARGDAGPPAVVAGGVTRHLLMTAAGAAVLLVGAELMVRGGIRLATAAGVSETVIGLSVVAFGTSLPELATSVTAALKGESEISVGNVLGSNVFNLGLVVGSAFMIRPSRVPVFVIRQDVPILVVVTAVVAAVVLRRQQVTRASGGVLVALFVLYLVLLVVRGG